MGAFGRAIADVGKGLMERNARKRELEEEVALKQKYAGEEYERELQKAKVLQQLKDDNAAAAEAAKAAREQFANLGDGQYAIHSNDPDTGKLNVRVEGERRAPMKYLSTDEGIVEYDPITGGKKRIAGTPPRAPAAWNDPSSIVRDLDDQWSRTSTQFDLQESAIKSKIASLTVIDADNKPALEQEIKSLSDMKAKREAEYKRRRQEVMGGGSSAAPSGAVKPMKERQGLLDIFTDAVSTAGRYGGTEQATVEGLTSGAVPFEVAAKAFSAQTGKPVTVGLDGNTSEVAQPPNPQAQANKDPAVAETYESVYAEAYAQFKSMPGISDDVAKAEAEKIAAPYKKAK